MTRTYAAAVNSYLSEPVHDFRLLVDLTLTNTTARLHTGVGSLMIGTTHYDGVGAFGGVERISEAPNNLIAPVKMWLSAVDSTNLSEAIGENLFGNAVVLRRCWLNGGTVVNTPEEWYRGVIGEVNIHRGDPERGNYIEIGVQTKLDRGWQGAYYTKEDLALTYSGDTFFNYTDQIPTLTAMWGQRPTRFSTYAPTIRARTQWVKV